MMAMIELASSVDLFSCSTLIICLDRQLTPSQLRSLVRDLGWVGFRVITLDRWACCTTKDVISSRWLFLSMEL